MTSSSRYNAKELDHLRKELAIALDKGKRHYWGDERGDYGFYSSDDQRCMKKARMFHRKAFSQLSKGPQLSNKQRVKTVGQEIHEREYQQRNPEIAKKVSLKSERKKNILSFSKNIDIQLPPIHHNISSKNFDPASMTKNNQRDYQPMQYSSAIENPNGQQGNTLELMPKNYIKQSRFNTDITCADPDLRRNFNVKYSPTFVCSSKNPLPTRKMYYKGDNSEIIYSMREDGP